jgi:anti-sigma B factor antagonist
MRISSAYDGRCAVVRLAGRLDGESAEQLSDTLDRLLRDGQRSVLLDMSGVNYLSSLGIHVLQRAYQEFSSLRGELRGGTGAGESELRRGLCWAAPITAVTRGA